MNVFYLAYEIHVRNFVRLGRVIVEICWKWVEIAPFHFQVRFLSDFFDFFFINLFYLEYEIHVKNFMQLCCVVVDICWKWVEISILWLLGISFIVSLLFACIWGFIIINGVTNIYNIYKCYEHFNHKWLGFLFGMGWMARRAFGWCSIPFNNYKISTSKNHVTMGKSQWWKPILLKTSPG